MAAVASVLWRDVVYKAFADTPVTISGTNDRGKFYCFDTSSGNIAVTLPTISGLNLTSAWALAVKKLASLTDYNTVTFTCGGTDTFDDGATTKVLSLRGGGAILVPDTDKAPDQWVVMDVDAEFLEAAFEADSATTGANQTVGATRCIKRMTNGSLTSICGLTAPSPAVARFAALINATGVDVTVVNDATATAANRIITGTGGNLTWKNTSTIFLAYDPTSARWRIVGGLGGGQNSVTVNNTITAGGTLTINTSDMEQTQYVQGNAAGVVSLSNTPFGTTPPPNGAKIHVVGTSDANAVTILFVDAANGCLMDGDVTFTAGTWYTFMYNSTLSRYVRQGA